MIVKTLATLALIFFANQIFSADNRNDWDLIQNESRRREYFEYKSNDLLKAVVDKESGDLMVLDENYTSNLPLKIGKILLLESLVLSGEVRTVPNHSKSNIFCFQRYPSSGSSILNNTYVVVYEKNKIHSYAFLSNLSCTDSVHENENRITIRTLEEVDLKRAIFLTNEFTLSNGVLRMKLKGRKTMNLNRSAVRNIQLQ